MKNIEISIMIKNNKAQIIISIALLILCGGIAWSFITGASTITVKTNYAQRPNYPHHEFSHTNNVNSTPLPGMSSQHIRAFNGF